MSAGHTPATPETSFEFIAEWFARAAKSATAKGNRESAQLWRDGLQHLRHLDAERYRLKAANAELVAALEAMVTDMGVDDYGAQLEYGDCQALDKGRAALANHIKESA